MPRKSSKTKIQTKDKQEENKKIQMSFVEPKAKTAKAIKNKT